MEILSGSDKQIIKPENDLKEYHFVELPNKVQAFLISNKKHLEHFQIEKEKVAPKSALNPLESKKFSPNPKLRRDILEEIAASISSPEHDDEFDENEDEEGEDEVYSDEGDSPDMSPDAKEKKSRRGLASVSVTICAGSCSEPEEFPGLAHLLEHIICLGSKEFPEEDSYTKFISKHGGFENAFTSLDSTTYEFDIDNEHLGEALYRFSRLLKEPLLKKEGIAKEVKAIDNEFELAAVDEDVQRFQVILSSFRKGHPLRIFPWGNAVSLNKKEEDLEEAVRKFYDSYYKTDAIKMCIYANYSLHELEAMFTKSFNDLEPKLSENNPQKENSKNPAAVECDIEASRKDLSGCYFLKTTGQVQTITFTWAIETLLWEYQVHPLNIVLALLNERGPGSLYHYLKQENFITDLGADTDDIDGQRNECLFLPYLWIKLTDNGMENLGKVIEATGEYLNMLTYSTLPDYYYNEAKAMSQYEFKYADEVSEEDLTNIISQSMKYIPYQNLLQSGVYRVHLKEDRVLVSKVFSQILLKHARIDVQAPEIPAHLKKLKVNSEVEYEFEEIYFKTKYTALNVTGLVDEKVYSKILENGFFSSENYYFPKKNPLIPDALKLQPVDDKYVLPLNITEKELDKQILWYRMDSEFRIPKASIQVLIIFNLKKEAPINTFLELLEHYLLEQYFQDLGNQARNANFDCSFDKHEYCGLELSVYGFSDNIVTLVQMIIDFLFHTLDHIQEDLLNQIVEKRIKHYEKVLDDPEKYLKTALIKCMFDYSLMPEEKINLLKSSDFADKFKLFCKTLAQPSTIKNVKTYGHGNLVLVDIKDLSVKIKSFVEKVSAKTEDSLSDMFIHKAEKLNAGLRKLPEKPLHVSMTSHIRKQKNNMALYFMDIGKDTLENRVLCQMLNQIFNTELFESLRMKQQIGYIANSYLLLMPGKRIGMEVWVSSSKLMASGLQAKIKEFVKWFCKDFLENYNIEDFEELKQSEISIKTRPLQTIQEVAHEFWSEIKSGSLMLNRKQEEIKYLTQLEFKKFRQWVREVIVKSKKVALELESRSENEEAEEEDAKGEPNKGNEEEEGADEGENDDEYEDIDEDEEEEEDEGEENNEGEEDFEALFKKNLTVILSRVEKLDQVWNYLVE